MCIVDEIPFEIPDSWEWVRLGCIINLKSGQDFEPSGYNSTGQGIPYITGASNIEEGKVIINRWTETPNNYAMKDDLLIVCKGAGVGKMAVLKHELVHIARQIMAITPIHVDLGYLQIVISSNLENLRRKMQGVIPGISRSDVLGLLFPLPPFKEQLLIASKVQESAFFAFSLTGIFCSMRIRDLSHLLVMAGLINCSFISSSVICFLSNIQQFPVKMLPY